MQFRLGLPVWAFPGWRDKYFEARPSMLASYARVFTAVEGNTSFYHVPGVDSIEQRRDALAGTSCTISFKLPSSLTHSPSIARVELDTFYPGLWF